jgi:uncharacterized repeat protein (TIGR02543 family)
MNNKKEYYPHMRSSLGKERRVPVRLLIHRGGGAFSRFFRSFVLTFLLIALALASQTQVFAQNKASSQDSSLSGTSTSSSSVPNVTTVKTDDLFATAPEAVSVPIDDISVLSAETVTVLLDELTAPASASAPQATKVPISQLATLESGSPPIMAASDEENDGVFKAFTAGDQHSLALTEDGIIWAWGLNDHGQLGDNTTTNRHYPVPLKDQNNAAITTKFKAIATGASTHSFALAEDGTLYSWGYNNYGQLGNNSTTDQHYPDTVKGQNSLPVTTKFKAVAAGENHTLALDTDGKMWAWGYNGNGQLGDNTWGVGSNKSYPVPVKDASGNDITTKFKAISVSYSSSLALAEDGTVWSWGTNPAPLKGQNGLPVTTKFKAISAGWYHSLALAEDGTIWAWGDNQYGQLGNHSTTSQLYPVTLKDSNDADITTKFKAISAGWQHSLAVATDGTGWAWGNNSVGFLGIGPSGGQQTSPVRFNVSAPLKDVAAGKQHSLALTVDDALYAWGSSSAYGTLAKGNNSISTQPWSPDGNSGNNYEPWRIGPQIKVGNAYASPYPGQTNVPLSGNITFTFDRPMDTSTRGVVTLTNPNTIPTNAPPYSTITLNTAMGSWGGTTENPTFTVAYAGLRPGTVNYDAEITGFVGYTKNALFNTSHPYRITSFKTTPSGYSVTFDPQGGRFPDGDTAKAVGVPQTNSGVGATMPPNPSKTDGSTFIGWATTSNATVPDFTDTTPVTGHRVVYAGWQFISPGDFKTIAVG